MHATTHVFMRVRDYMNKNEVKDYKNLQIYIFIRIGLSNIVH